MSIVSTVEEIPEQYREAHKRARLHREEVTASRFVGCFYCLLIFAPKSIKEWTDDERTAICPVCQVDAVLPLTEEQFNNDEFLPAMRRYWF